MGGVHQVEGSPLYGDKNYKNTGIYQKSTRHTFRIIKIYFSQNIYIAIPLLIILIKNPEIPQEIYLSSIVSLIVFLIGIISYIIPFLRGIGFGLQYGKLCIPFVLLSIPYALSHSFLIYSVIIIILIYIYKCSIYLIQNLLTNNEKSNES